MAAGALENVLNLKHLAVAAEGSVFADWLESGTIVSVCRQTEKHGGAS